MEKNVTLPLGCHSNNEILETLNVGECRRESCSISIQSDTDDIQSPIKYCCGPTDYQQVDIQCDDVKLTFDVIQECGCRQCLRTDIFIIGAILSSVDDSPVNGTEVWYNEQLVDISTLDGNFNFSIEGELDRIVITIKVRDGSNLADTTQTVAVEKTVEGVIFVTIRLLERGPSVQGNAKEEVTTPIYTSNTNSTLGDIVIPPDSFYLQDGHLFEVSQSSINIIFSFFKYVLISLARFIYF